MRVLTFGTFDRLHPGHRAYLGQAQMRGDLTIVVARDGHVRQIKGHGPAQHEEERAEALKKAFPKATVVLGDSMDFTKPLRDFSPDLVILGYDQKLPPGVRLEDFPCPVERAEPFEPERFKSSLMG